MSHRAVDVEGTIEYWDDDRLLHRDDDQPAFIKLSGTRMWMYHGKIHRDGDEPAVIYADGSMVWYKYGCGHRDHGLPSYISNESFSGYEWWYNGARYFPKPEKI